jgi:hypothetical protein
VSSHPVQFQVEPSPMRRVQVVIRLALLAALAAVGCSSIYWIAYLALPVAAAMLVSRDGAVEYLGADSPRILRVVRWLAGAYAYLWLLTDVVPTTEPVGPVELTVEVGGRPTPASAIARLVTSLPALVLLAVLSIAASIFWVFGAIAILTSERVPAGIADFIAMKLRYQFRLIAYHLSLVDAYPTLAELRLAPTPPRGAT